MNGQNAVGFPVPECEQALKRNAHTIDLQRDVTALVDCALSLAAHGARRDTIDFIVLHTGLVVAFAERLIWLRANDIDEPAIERILYNVFTQSK